MLNTLPLISVALILFFSSIIISAILILRIPSNNPELKSLESDLAKLKRDLRNVCSGVVGMGQRIHALEMILKQLSLRQDQSNFREPDTAQYAHAAKLAEVGASVEEIVKSSGVSRAEADLICVLHKKENVA